MADDPGTADPEAADATPPSGMPPAMPPAPDAPRTPTRDTRIEATAGRSPTGDTRVEGAGGSESGRPTAPGGDEPDDLGERIRQRLARADSEGPRKDPLIGAEVGGRFSIVEKIGEGGMGAVYRARQKNMDRDVAIKVLLRSVAKNETVVRRFHLEALAVSKLRNPNTIQIFDFGETDEGQLYIAMEFLDGISLHKLLERDTVVSVKRALRVAEQVARSLREAHGKGIIHRDLKPDNVFLVTMGEETDYVKVLDFGVAKLRDSESASNVTKTGTIFGTPKYMSPEQARGLPVDARSDLYAIGIMLYEMLTGRVPFDADSSLGILVKHIQEAPPPFQVARPDLVHPQEVEDLVMRLLAKRPEDRPQSAEALVRELEKLQQGLDEVFRNVVTREDAIRIGVEIATSAHTHHDTELTGAAAAAAATVGGFGDETVGVRHAGERERRRWPVAVLAASALLVLAVVGLAVTYMNLEPLPDSYRGLPALASLEVGTVAEIRPDEVLVTIGSNPPEADVLRDGEKVGVTPYALRGARGSAPVTLVFQKEDYKPYRRTFELDEDQSLTLQLMPLHPPPEPVATPEPEPESEPGTTSRTRPRPTRPSAPVAETPKSPTVTPTTSESPSKPPENVFKPVPTTKPPPPNPFERVRETK